MSTDREEFEKTRRKLYALAERMGMRLTIIVRRRPDAAKPATAPSGANGAQTKTEREPGDDW